MSSEKAAVPKIVSKEEWMKARKELLHKEKELTKTRDALSAQRRRLPMVKVEKDYVFEGPNGKVKLIDLFNGKNQLIVYHFMFSPDWEKGCPSCTMWADEMLSKGMLEHMEKGDTAFTCISRAPFEKLEKYKNDHSWTFPWHSSNGTTFNFDFQVTVDDDHDQYNYKSIADHKRDGTGYYFEGEAPQEQPGTSAFLKVGDEVFHTYSTFGRGNEATGGSPYFLDLTAYGRQESWEDSPEGWPQKPMHYDPKPKEKARVATEKSCCDH